MRRVALVHPASLRDRAEAIRAWLGRTVAEAHTIEVPDGEGAKTAEVLAFCWGVLGRQGFTNVRHLDGSLFAWANEGRPMVSDGRPVREVHPYNDFWGRLLKPEVRSDAPPVTDPYSLP